LEFVNCALRKTPVTGIAAAADRRDDQILRFCKNPRKSSRQRSLKI
jgi:hypothetical protein